VEARRVIPRRKRDRDHGAGSRQGDGGDGNYELETGRQGFPDGSGNTVWRYYRF
jgi:hypothetical protein